MRLIAPQKYFGAKAFFVCLLAIDLCLILAIDMYAPALPGMQQSFGVSVSYLNLTMFAFFIFTAVGVLFAGPCSDRFGRKPILVSGAVAFAASSAVCGFAPTVEVLIAGRVVQAIGNGFVVTVLTAMIKDSYAGRDLKMAMTCMQSLVVIGPAAAPFLGTFLLTIGGWREIFFFLAALGIVATVLSCLASETHVHVEREAGSVGESLRSMCAGMAHLARDRAFSSLALFMGVAGMPYFAFIAVVSYILLNDFGASYMVYNIVYAVACLVTLVAPFLYAWLSRTMPSRRILLGCLALTLATGVLLAAFGAISPWAFLLAFIPYALAEGIVRPLAFVDLLDQPPARVGAAASAANLCYTVLTSVATVFATFEWPTLLIGLWIITLASAAAMGALYLAGIRKHH